MSWLGRKLQQSPLVAAALAQEADKHAPRLREADEVLRGAGRAVERMSAWRLAIMGEEKP